MLKRLFISLLILSALTSEGIVKLPANIYNLYIHPGSRLGLTWAKVMPCMEQPSQVKSSSGRLLSSVPGRSFALTYSSLEKLGTVPDECETGGRYEHNSSYLNINPNTLSFFKDYKDTILKKSDTSPPFLSYKL